MDCVGMTEDLDAAIIRRCISRTIEVGVAELAGAGVVVDQAFDLVRAFDLRRAISVTRWFLGLEELENKLDRS